MKVVDNIIVEATELELYKLYLKREMYDVLSFYDYLLRFKELGCKILAK